MALMTDVHSIQENFTNLIRRANTPALAKFIVWLDMKVAEYKVNGFMSLDQQVTIKPRWMQEADEESAIQNHKRKVCEFFNQDVRQGEGDRNNGSSVSNKDEVSVDLECSQTPAESLCKRKKAEDGNHSPRSQENARLTDNTESTETQQKRSDENNCETVVKEEVIDLDYEDSIHSSHAARCYSDVSERNNTFLDQSIKSKKTSYSSLPSQDTQSNTSRLSVSENRVFLSPPSSQSVSQGNLTFLPREGRIQKSNSLEQLTNKKFSSVSQPTRERTAMPSSTVTSKSVSSSFSNDNYMEEPAYTRTEESDIALCMKVESVDEDLGDDLEMHELHESELNDIRGLKTTYFGPNSVININERLDAGGFDPASFGTSSFRGENSSFQDPVLQPPFPVIPGYRQTYTSDAHIAVDIKSGKPIIFAQNNMDEQRDIMERWGVKGSTLFDRISSKHGRQHLECPYCQYLTKRTFNYRRHLLSHGVVFYQRVMNIETLPNFNFNSPRVWGEQSVLSDQQSQIGRQEAFELGQCVISEEESVTSERTHEILGQQSVKSEHQVLFPERETLAPEQHHVIKKNSPTSEQYDISEHKSVVEID